MDRPTQKLGAAIDDTVEFLVAELKKIEGDQRFHYPPAQIQINAPLALIQIQLKARHDALEECLKKIEVHFPHARKEGR